MSQTILTLIPWLAVPIILIALLLFAIRIVTRVSDPEAKLSARGGFWAGFILFLIFITTQLHLVSEPRLDFSTVPNVEVVPLLVGVVAGLGLLWAVRALVATRWVGVTTLLLTAVSTGALFGFLFVDGLRVTVLYAALGVALGALVHVTLWPSTIRNLWTPRARVAAESQLPIPPGFGQ